MDKKELLLKAYLGECIPGLIHDVGSPLGGMLGFVKILEDEITWLRHDVESYSEHELREHVQSSLAKISEMFVLAARSEQSVRRAMDKLVVKCNHDFDTQKTDIDLNELIRVESDVLMTNAFFKHKINRVFDYGAGPFRVHGLWRTYSQPVGSIMFRYVKALETVQGPRLTMRTESDRGRLKLVIGANAHLVQEDLFANPDRLMPALTLQECTEVMGARGTISYSIIDAEQSSVIFDLALGDLT